MKSLKNVAGFRRGTLCLSLALLSVVGAIERAGLRKEVGLLRPGPRGPKVLRQKWYNDVPGARSTRDGDTGNEDNSSFARCFKLDKYAMFSFALTSGLASDFDKSYAMFSFALTSGLASDFDKFKIITTLRRAKIWRYGTLQKFNFSD